MRKKICLFLIIILTIILVSCLPKDNLQKVVESNKTPNVYTVSRKVDNAPIYDSKTNEIVGYAYKGFSLSIENENDNNVYFPIPISDSNENEKLTTKDYYIPTKYLQKEYKEPFMVIEIISLDSILLNENAPIYNNDDNCIVKFKEKLGPIRYIQKTDKGYQLVLGQNLIYLKEEDVNIIKHKDK